MLRHNSTFHNNKSSDQNPKHQIWIHTYTQASRNFINYTIYYLGVILSQSQIRII
jgi:hypothetical protein